MGKKKQKTARHQRRAEQRNRTKQVADSPDANAAPAAGVFTTPAVKIMGTNPAKRKDPSANPPLAEDFAQEVGNVALTWTYLENEFTAVLVSLEAAAPPPEKVLNRGGFAGLIARWRHAQKALFGTCPTLLAHFKDVTERMTDKQWRRNFLIHGKTKCELTIVALTLPDGTPYGANMDRALVVTGFKRINGTKQEVTERFTSESLDDLFHEVAHLAGQVRALALDSVAPAGVTEADWAPWRALMTLYPPAMQP